MEEKSHAIDLEAALEQASDEIGLPSYYRSCVRPLLRQPKHEWPTCCGAGCDPCAQTLVAVAERVFSLTTEGPESR